MNGRNFIHWQHLSKINEKFNLGQRRPKFACKKGGDKHKFEFVENLPNIRWLTGKNWFLEKCSICGEKKFRFKK